MTLIDSLPKKDIQIADKHVRRYFTYHVIKNLIIETTIVIPEWPKSRTLTTPNADEDVKQQEFSYIPGRNANGTATLEKFIGFSQK